MCTSLIDNLLLASYDGQLCLCDWRSHGADVAARRICRRLGAERLNVDSDVVRLASEQFREYLAGARREFTVPLLPIGTPFQRRVWEALMDIPYGATVSYGELARRLGMPSACRAVAAAVGANPLSIFVPCHRVVAAGGAPGGYAGGVETKLSLLRLESQ